MKGDEGTAELIADVSGRRETFCEANVPMYTLRTTYQSGTGVRKGIQLCSYPMDYYTRIFTFAVSPALETHGT